MTKMDNNIWDENNSILEYKNKLQNELIILNSTTYKDLRENSEIRDKISAILEINLELKDTRNSSSGLFAEDTSLNFPKHFLNELKKDKIDMIDSDIEFFNSNFVKGFLKENPDKLEVFIALYKNKWDIYIGDFA